MSENQTTQRPPVVPWAQASATRCSYCNAEAVAVGHGSDGDFYCKQHLDRAPGQTDPLDVKEFGTPIFEFEWRANNMALRTLTCVRHQDLRWLTKHPTERTLHYLGHADGSYVKECACPMADLRVLPEA